MKYEVTHRTAYVYADPVTLGHNETHLTPRNLARQRCLSHRLVILPTPSSLRNWTDYYGNHVTYFTVEEEHRELSVTSISSVEISQPSHPQAQATPPWEEARDSVPGDGIDLTAAMFRPRSRFACGGTTAWPIMQAYRLRRVVRYWMLRSISRRASSTNSNTTRPPRASARPRWKFSRSAAVSARISRICK